MDDFKRPRRHDFTAERIKTVSHPSATQETQESSVKSQRLSAKIPSKTAAVSLLALLAIAVFAGLSNQNHPKITPSPAPQTSQKSQTPKWQAPVKASPAPTPAAVSKQINSTPYYPTNLPTTFRSNNDTQLIGKDTVYYSYSDDKGNQYYVTQQPTPANFNYNAFKGSLSDVEEFNVPTGSAVIGVSGNELVGGIRTNNSLWILVGASNTSLRSQLKTLMNSLQPVTAAN
jgi:hypothetical protein